MSWLLITHMHTYIERPSNKKFKGLFTHVCSCLLCWFKSASVLNLSPHILHLNFFLLNMSNFISHVRYHVYFILFIDCRNLQIDIIQYNPKKKATNRCASHAMRSLSLKFYVLQNKFYSIHNLHPVLEFRLEL